MFNIYKWIYLIGRELRNKKIKCHEQALFETDFTSLDTLQQIQLERLKELLTHATENSNYYRHKLSHINIDNITLETLGDIPILTKDEFRDNIHNIQNYISEEKFFKSSTSGSTGKSLTFDRGLDWDAATRAAQTRAYSWYGINHWDRNLYFWGFNPNWKQLLKIRILDLLLNRYRVFSYNEKTRKKLKAYLKKCDYLEGYSSAIYSLASELNKDGLQYTNIKMVKGTSEKIFDSYHKASLGAFGHKITSEYGAAETGVIAFECPHGNMHIAMENVIVEAIDNKIIVTNLFSKTAPIIRYELGDYVVFNYDKRCPCGRSHPIIGEVTGRVGSKIRGFKDEYPSLVIYYMFKNIIQKYNLAVTYSACQYIKGELIIKIIYDKEGENLLMNYINSEKEHYFNDDIDVKIIFTDKIEESSKKTQSFVSYIDKDISQPGEESIYV